MLIESNQTTDPEQKSYFSRLWECPEKRIPALICIACITGMFLVLLENLTNHRTPTGFTQILWAFSKGLGFAFLYTFLFNIGLSLLSPHRFSVSEFVMNFAILFGVQFNIFYWLILGIFSMVGYFYEPLLYSNQLAFASSTTLFFGITYLSMLSEDYTKNSSVIVNTGIRTIFAIIFICSILGTSFLLLSAIFMIIMTSNIVLGFFFMEEQQERFIHPFSCLQIFLAIWLMTAGVL